MFKKIDLIRKIKTRYLDDTWHIYDDDQTETIYRRIPLIGLVKVKENHTFIEHEFEQGSIKTTTFLKEPTKIKGFGKGNEED